MGVSISPLFPPGSSGDSNDVSTQILEFAAGFLATEPNLSWSCDRNPVLAELKRKFCNTVKPCTSSPEPEAYREGRFGVHIQLGGKCVLCTSLSPGDLYAHCSLRSTAGECLLLVFEILREGCKLNWPKVCRSAVALLTQLGIGWAWLQLVRRVQTSSTCFSFPLGLAALQFRLLYGKSQEYYRARQNRRQAFFMAPNFMKRNDAEYIYLQQTVAFH
ncbi:uncharacterized protein [Symphalangus syndactylus]|uniref:uncharacterized protein n=1 Tax=Symphalangus syndactylus TaxID=9590 RepID=UPI002441AB53|nr:uncharacterized protein LOC129484124 [Symphalangus syndactylus]